jgi:hypothetical protein
MRTLNLEEYRIRASRLLKELRGSNLEAAQRFRILAEWADQTPEQIVQQHQRLRRKHALTVIAKEVGFSDWVELKSSFEFDTTKLFPPNSAVFLNIWCRSYDEAKQILTARPAAFLFPYRHQFVIVEAGLVEALGVDPHNPDWEAIGRDWVQPLERAAHARLSRHLSRILK